MSDLEVRIVKLEALRVASMQAYGASPEGMTWDKLVAWARPKGSLESRVWYYDIAAVPERVAIHNLMPRRKRNE